ncbi:MAG: alpha-isopropylmalate synthase regulatory domain-containing protein [Bacteroidales bacterium]|nr:alpha-isopropylmalate synthase regulatory domain-containing protein [Bacteroidales bacterium]
MDRRIFVSDITMKLADGVFGNVLSFRQKLEFSKLLDMLGVSVIETCGLSNGKKDVLLVKSLASAIRNSTLAIPVDIFSNDSISETWNALMDARHPRLQVSVPVSTVQMEYLCHLKPAAVLELVGSKVKECRSLCDDVEFIAVDFTRADTDFLFSIIDTAIQNGATVITMHDSAGTLFGFEFHEVIEAIRAHIPENVRLGVNCSNELFLADSCAVAAVCAGADEIKTVPHGRLTTSLKRFVKILETKSELCHASCDINTLEILRTIEQIKAVCTMGNRNNKTASDSSQDGNALQLTRHDNKETVVAIANKLGYYLDEDDSDKVYDAFLRLASENGKVEAKELDAIIASVAFQAPAKYNLESYLINSGNTITATCHMRLMKDNTILEGVCLGDGPVDAAFQTIEQLVGKRYELDDFQIQSVTEGREAMGRAVVRLCHEGTVFSGCGISRDVVGASIMAYLSAVNKIEFEEANA